MASIQQPLYPVQTTTGAAAGAGFGRDGHLEDSKPELSHLAAAAAAAAAAQHGPVNSNGPADVSASDLNLCKNYKKH